VADGTEEFAITMRGYDRAQVDQRMEAVRRQLAEARREVAALDQRAMTLAGELADAQRRLRESDKPTYAGLGSRIEHLLRSAEEQSASMKSKADADAEALLARARTNASRLAKRSSSEAARGAVRAADLDAGARRTGSFSTLTSDHDRTVFIESVRQALYGSKIAAYAQGFDEIATASAENGWNVDLGAMARIWRGGCIIRARFLDDITRAYEEDHEPASLLTAPVFARALETALPAWREVVATSALAGVAAPAFASSLAYIDQLRAPRLPAALIQGQRDFFGSHTYHRVDDPEGVYHVLWAQDGRPEEKWD